MALDFRQCLFLHWTVALVTGQLPFNRAIHVLTRRPMVHEDSITLPGVTEVPEIGSSQSAPTDYMCRSA